ncbi:MAG: extracellular solute-binding protein [Ruminiclostridium sp.]|nr:extracellular solute-binding protein [Ruminiclostridium sp.]
MKKSIKVMSLLLALCFVVTLAACGANSDGKNASQTTSAAQGSSDATTAPAANEPVKLTYLMEDWGTIKGSADEKLVLERIKEETGVELIPIAIPSEGYDDKVNLKFAAGEDFDLYREANAGSGKPWKVNERYADGLIKSLSPYIDEYGPLFKDETVMPKDFLASATIDNNIVGMPYGQALGSKYVITVRKDWLNKLGLSEPATIEEYQAFLEKVKETDLNGNGQMDEVPLYTGGWVNGPQWKEIFLVHGGNDWIDENGGYNAAILDPNYKLMLKTLQDWYKKGLIWKEAYTAQPEQAREMSAKNLVASYGFWWSEPEYAAMNFRASVPEVENVVILPKGPGLNKKLQEKRPFGLLLVTSKCKNPEKAVALMNWALTTDGANTLTYGIEGVHWQYGDVEKKSVNLMGVVNNDASKAKYYAQYALFGGLPNIPFVNNIFNYYYSAVVKTVNSFPQEEFLGKDFVYNDANWESKKYINDMETLIKENEQKIIMGQTSADEWDNVIKKWREIGGDIFLKEKGQAYKELSAKAGAK